MRTDLRVLGLVMAGGEGRRLMPLTADRSKPAVPFGGSYRIVDFVLSNLLNSGIYSTFVLVQYRSQSLIHHLREGWRLSTPHPDDFLTIVPPQMRVGKSWYSGTADAVYQNFNLIFDFKPDLIAVFGADHVYRMDIGHMIRFHREKEAALSIAMLPVPVADAAGFGVAEADPEDSIVSWAEKSAAPPEMSGRPGYVYASMGNYLFEPAALVNVLREVSEAGLEPDFGKTIVPRMVQDPKHRVCAYDFLRNRVPGVRSYEEAGYWRDIGTLEAYHAAHMDLLGAQPRFDLNNKSWPVHSQSYHRSSARILGGTIEDASIGVGSVIDGARIVRSVIGRSTRIEPGAEIIDSIVMDHCRVGAGARIHRGIIDRYNYVDAGETVSVGDCSRADAHVAGDLIALPRGRTRPL
ncbi:MAG: glucose-1-phosphate adenylyltransferase [Gemmatimonadota bacterium]|nr:glucose-1-phosphate adenylyltransferase [Gemmatimonadota bacterium]MDH3427540.1 glucose-1-phosphate adenylyltransferase [Gemmatimonadota bacterium]